MKKFKITKEIIVSKKHQGKAGIMGKEDSWCIEITGKGIKRYKQIKRLIDLLNMRWFD